MSDDYIFIVKSSQSLLSLPAVAGEVFSEFDAA